MDKLIYELPDDLINKIYSFVLYKQSENLLIEIKNYYIKKVYINLFYKTINIKDIFQFFFIFRLSK